MKKTNRDYPKTIYLLRHTEKGRQIERKVMQPLVKYMHTISGMPAEYYEGEQICYHKRYKAIKLADSLKQIKTEQKLSNAWRKKQGFYDKRTDYGWVRIAVA